MIRTISPSWVNIRNKPMHLCAVDRWAAIGTSIAKQDVSVTSTQRVYFYV